MSSNVCNGHFVYVEKDGVIDKTNIRCNYCSGITFKYHHSLSNIVKTKHSGYGLLGSHFICLQLPFHLSVCPGTKVGVKFVGALAISPSDATYLVEWKPALKCVNARLIFLTLTINAIKKINCLAALD